jgi:hypothetical protein
MWRLPGQVVYSDATQLVACVLQCRRCMHASPSPCHVWCVLAQVGCVNSSPVCCMLGAPQPSAPGLQAANGDQWRGVHLSGGC